MAERETTTPHAVGELARIGVVLMEDGTFRAELKDSEFVTRSLDELMEAIRVAVRAAHQSTALRDAGGESCEPEEEDDGVGFEDDMDYVLTKNAELYRRLAR
jgi:hypothetical protein